MGNTSIQTQSYRAVDKDAGQSRSYIIPFALLCSLFFLWAVANNLNDILLPQFQQAFTLTNFQAGLIQSAFYFGYFIIPIPAGILMKKLSYKIQKKRLVHLAGESARFASRILYDSINVVMPVRLKAL